MDVYDNAKTHSKSEGEKKKPKVSRKQHSDASQQMVRELFAKEIEEGMVELKKSNKTLQSQNKSGRRRSQRSVIYFLILAQDVSNKFIIKKQSD